MVDEETPALSEDTLKILNEFLLEKAQREQSEQLSKGKEAIFEEDWQLSQFWYNNETKQKLVGVTQKLKSELNSVALLSCPSLYATFKTVCANVKLFEFDRRFQAYGDDFVFYDFNEAEMEDYLKNHWNAFDLIIADPPFLSEECIMKISKIINNLMKNNTRLIFCSGEIVENWVQRYLNLKKCNFRPQHERNLGNEFTSYANFNLDDFIVV